MNNSNANASANADATAYARADAYANAFAIEERMASFYHGGVPGLPVGTYILPPSETGVAGGAKWNDRVYVTTDIMLACWVAAVVVTHYDRGDPMLYRVKPVGGLGPDDNGERGPDYTCRKALILASAPVDGGSLSGRRRWTRKGAGRLLR